MKCILKDSILVHGGATLVSSLFQSRFIDELYLLINPVVIGDGLTAFRYYQQFDEKMLCLILRE
ncbi:dihydrofolate reductase family protein [Danxiaibacter flavus]|uniref:dihydrofolate reductase family protein n=1 Tax=Danxiaibacter flavus TaxID=3049108 RepID=UPI0034E09038